MIRPGLLRSELWHQATIIRRAWLEIGLTTEPAGRPETEQAITEIYARHGRPRPGFLWALSPREAAPHLAGLPTHETLRGWLADRRPPGIRPLSSDIAAGLSRLRSALLETYEEPPYERPPMKRKKGEHWPVRPPAEAISAGLPLAELLRQGVQEALHRSLAGIYVPIRTALAHLLPASDAMLASGVIPVGGAVSRVPVGWFGHQDAYWIAHIDALRRLGLVHPHNLQDFAPWAALAGSAGWWWPGEDRCVLVERPAVIDTEPVPGAWHEEVRLRRDPHRPAVEYRDGWAVHLPA